MRFKRILRGSLLLLFLCILVVFFCNFAIDKAAEGKLYDNVEAVPYNKVGLLLGTSKFLSSGYINYYYKYRIDAAAQLYKARKISYLVISGDNSRNDYNEPELMR